MSGLAQGAAARRITQLCATGGTVYLHKSSGIRYRVAYTIAGTHELHPISGPCRYATDEQLGDAEVWERQP